MDKVVVRQATPSDFDDIVRISKGLHQGYDLLPGIYLTCLENPNRCAQVAEWNGEIVAFSAVLVVDGGRTAILQYGRCAEAVRGKGIFRQLALREFAEFVYPKFPRIVRMRTSSANTDFWDAKNDGTIIEMRRVIVCCPYGAVPYEDFVRLLTPQRMAALRQQLSIDSLSPADGHTLNSILADPVSKTQLFPEGIIVSQSEIFDAHESNTFAIMQNCFACFAGGSASSMYTSLSLGHVYSCPIGRVCDIDYYGPKDDSVILAHVARYLPLTRDIWLKRPVALNVFVKEACFGAETQGRFQQFVTANIAPHGPPVRYVKFYAMTHPLVVPNSQL